MKTDDAYSVDSILQRFMEKIPLKSFSEQYLRDHYICFSVVESIKADYSVAVITEGDYVDLNDLNGFSKPENKSSYVGLNTNQRIYAAEHPPYPSKEIIEEIHNRFGLTGWTVEEIISNKITSFKIFIPVCFIIPDIGDNISFVNNVMASFGYYNIASSQERLYNMDYVYMIYNPVSKFNCNEWLKDKLRKTDYLLYHMTTPDCKCREHDVMIMKDNCIEFLNAFIEECPLDKIPESVLRKQYIIYTVVKSIRKLSRMHTLNNNLNETDYVNVDLQSIEVPDDYRDDCILCPPKYVRDEIIRKLDLEN